jgi:phenylpropionate dioxygenase-like ring-hydroxylating dioxygenase large terminal subunit
MTSTISSAPPSAGLFDEDPERSYTLPAAYYTDPAIFEMEKEAVFFRSWQFVGHVSQARARGDYFTCAIFDQSLIVIRGQDDTIRAFHNVCQHRAHRLLEGAGNTAIITCPYHAWACDTDGPLRNAPNWRNIEGFDRKDVCLSAVRVELFHGFLFVNLDVDAQLFAERTGAFAEEVRAFAPNCADLVHAHRVQYPVKENWNLCFIPI